MDEVSLDQQIDMTIKAIRGVIISEKPALKAKTFVKLPIRFVHEVVTSIMQCTGFGDTLFEDRPELQNFSEQFRKSKDLKEEYFSRLLNFTQQHSGSPIHFISVEDMLSGKKKLQICQWLEIFATEAKSSSRESSANAVRQTLDSTNPRLPILLGAENEDNSGNIPEDADVEERSNSNTPMEALRPDSLNRSASTPLAVRQKSELRSMHAESQGEPLLLETSKAGVMKRLIITGMELGVEKPHPSKYIKHFQKTVPFKAFVDVFVSLKNQSGFASNLFDDRPELMDKENSNKLEFFRRVTRCVDFFHRREEGGWSLSLLKKCGKTEEGALLALQLLLAVALAAKECKNGGDECKQRCVEVVKKSIEGAPKVEDDFESATYEGGTLASRTIASAKASVKVSEMNGVGPTFLPKLKEEVVEQLVNTASSIGVEKPIPSKYPKHFKRVVPFKAFVDVFVGLQSQSGFASGLFEDRPELMEKENPDKSEFFRRITDCVDLFDGRKIGGWDIGKLEKSSKREESALLALQLLLAVALAAKECRSGSYECLLRNSDAVIASINPSSSHSILPKLDKNISGSGEIRNELKEDQQKNNLENEEQSHSADKSHVENNNSGEKDHESGGQNHALEDTHMKINKSGEKNERSFHHDISATKTDIIEDTHVENNNSIVENDSSFIDASTTKTDIIEDTCVERSNSLDKNDSSFKDVSVTKDVSLIKAQIRPTDDDYDDYDDDYYHEPDDHCYQREDGCEYMGHVDHQGNPNGQGIMIYSPIDPTEHRAKYSGRWRDGVQSGKGTLTWRNGDVYTGSFAEDKLHGIGELLCSDGSRYKGRWKEGYKHGKGEYSWANGNYYVGNWKEGRLHGSGTKVWGDGRYSYEGTWKKGVMHGIGTFCFPGGNTHGFFEKGKLHGRHVAIFDETPGEIFEAEYDMTNLGKYRRIEELRRELQPETNEVVDFALQGEVAAEKETTLPVDIDDAIYQLISAAKRLGIVKPNPDKFSKWFRVAVPFKAFIDVYRSLDTTTSFTSNLFEDRPELLNREGLYKEEFFRRLTTYVDVIQGRQEGGWNIENLKRIDERTSADRLPAVQLLLAMALVAEESLRGGKIFKKRCVEAVAKSRVDTFNARGGFEIVTNASDSFTPVTSEMIEGDGPKFLPKDKEAVMEKLISVASNIGVEKPEPNKYPKYFKSKVPFRAFVDVFVSLQSRTGFASGLFDDKPELLEKGNLDKKEFFRRVADCVDLFSGHNVGGWDLDRLQRLGKGIEDALLCLQLLLSVAMAAEKCLSGGDECKQKNAVSVKKSVEGLAGNTQEADISSKSAGVFNDIESLGYASDTSTATPFLSETLASETKAFVKTAADTGDGPKFLPNTKEAVLEKLVATAANVGIEKPIPSRFPNHFKTGVPFRAFVEVFVGLQSRTGFAIRLFDDRPELLQKQNPDKGEFFRRIADCVDFFEGHILGGWQIDVLQASNKVGASALQSLQLLLAFALAAENFMNGDEECKQRAVEAVTVALNKVQSSRNQVDAPRCNASLVDKDSSNNDDGSTTRTAFSFVPLDMPLGGKLKVHDRATGNEHNLVVPKGLKKGDSIALEIPSKTRVLTSKIPKDMPLGGLVSIRDSETNRTFQVHVPFRAKKNDMCDIEVPIPL